MYQDKKAELTHKVFQAMSETMGIAPPAAMLRADPELLDTVNFEHMAFLLYYGHHQERGAIEGSLSKFFEQWRCKCGGMTENHPLYQLRHFYHKVFLSKRPKMEGVRMPKASRLRKKVQVNEVENALAE